MGSCLGKNRPVAISANEISLQNWGNSKIITQNEHLRSEINCKHIEILTELKFIKNELRKKQNNYYV